MSAPILVLKNQYGEESTNEVTTGTTFPGASPVAAHSVMMNNTNLSALPAPVLVQSVSNALPAKTGVAAINAEDLATAITISLSTGDVYTDAAVNAAVNGALVTVVADINAAIAQINAILAALKVVS